MHTNQQLAYSAGQQLAYSAGQRLAYGARQSPGILRRKDTPVLSSCQHRHPEMRADRVSVQPTAGALLSQLVGIEQQQALKDLYRAIRCIHTRGIRAHLRHGVGISPLIRGTGRAIVPCSTHSRAEAAAHEHVPIMIWMQSWQSLEEVLSKETVSEPQPPRHAPHAHRGMTICSSSGGQYLGRPQSNSIALLSRLQPQITSLCVVCSRDLLLCNCSTNWLIEIGSPWLTKSAHMPSVLFSNLHHTEGTAHQAHTVRAHSVQRQHHGYPLCFNITVVSLHTRATCSGVHTGSLSSAPHDNTCPPYH